MSLLDVVKKRGLESVGDSSSECTFSLYLSTVEENPSEFAFDVQEKSQKKTIINDNKYFKTLDDLREQILKYEYGTSNFKKGKRKRTGKPKTLIVTESCLYRTLEKCIIEKSCKTSLSSLIYLIESDLITSPMYKLLVEWYKENDDMKLLTIMLSKLDIGEEFVVDMLQIVLKNINDDTCHRLLHNEKARGCCVNKFVLKRIVLLCSVELHLSSLKEQLKLLAAKEAMVLLKILEYLAKQTSLALNSDDTFKFDKGRLTEIKILSWIDVLVSAHTITFATNNPMKSTIRSLGSMVNYQVQFNQIINELVPYVDIFKAGYELPSRPENYAIQTLTL